MLLFPCRLMIFFFLPLTLMKSGFSAAAAADASAEIWATEIVLLAPLCPFVEESTSSTRVMSVELATEQTLPSIVSSVVFPAAHSNSRSTPSSIGRFASAPPYQCVSTITYHSIIDGSGKGFGITDVGCLQKLAEAACAVVKGHTLGRRVARTTTLAYPEQGYQRGQVRLQLEVVLRSILKVVSVQSDRGIRVSLNTSVYSVYTHLPSVFIMFK